MGGRTRHLADDTYLGVRAMLRNHAPILLKTSKL